MSERLDSDFDWQCYPLAEQLVHRWVGSFLDAHSFVADLRTRMLSQTGTRLADWIDHFGIPESDPQIGSPAECGFLAENSGNDLKWRHPGGLFPAIHVGSFETRRLVVRVESVADFLFAHDIDSAVEGAPMSPLRRAKISATNDAEFWVIERHGTDDGVPRHVSAEQQVAALVHAETLTRRRRQFDHEADGFEHAAQLIAAATDALGVDWACDLFFAAERRYWQSRNRAARVQHSRQNQLGLGWANHDHHTYRSSREHFTRLIGLLEQLGFQCRERFYGGAEAGWGAQVLEQPVARIVIFADVDLSADEVTGDFAHQGLPVADRLGTVGLWCKLHGEAMLQAGMHHLECQFDFDAARRQLADAGIRTMEPFTDFNYLKQAFTEGEVWPVSERRIDAALAGGWITPEQAAKFRASGSIGSHLEILQRDDGYKGFNQTGISEIIRQTDPRRAVLEG